MKKIIFLAAMILFIVNSFELSAQSQSRELEIEKINTLIVNNHSSLVRRAIKMNTSEVMIKAITFEVVKNLQTNEITLDNFNEQDIFPIGGEEEIGKITQKYSVTCSGGNDGDWTASCGNKFSCGGLVADCLEQGGCATVCNSSVVNGTPLYSSVKITYIHSVN